MRIMQESVFYVEGFTKNVGPSKITVPRTCLFTKERVHILLITTRSSKPQTPPYLFIGDYFPYMYSLPITDPQFRATNTSGSVLR